MLEDEFFLLFKLKSKLLIHGCAVSPTVKFPSDMHSKKVHLYAHSPDQASSESLPDDIILVSKNFSLFVRIRFNRQSNLEIIESNGCYYVLDNESRAIQLISFVPKHQSEGVRAGKHTVGSVCSYLGPDLLGVIPSNYCFYFGQKKQCQFCEILPNFKTQVDFPKAFKSSEIIINSIAEAFQHSKYLKHLAITTGNIKSYDYSVEYFISIGRLLSEAGLFSNIEDCLATLMPPKNLKLLGDLKESGFNKIYFPIEVYDERRFSEICPGKNEYGYHNLIEALEVCVGIFGPGNVYTNLIYGLQSTFQDKGRSSNKGAFEQENFMCEEAVHFFLDKKIIPAFTIYHYSGHNQIGKLNLDHNYLSDFFVNWGEWVYRSGLVAKEKQSVIFGNNSLTNTLYNDGFFMKVLEQEVQCG